MPKTPVQDDRKSNPFISKSISKTLLTPCRQVGLSRKRKTPNSCNTSLSESSTVNTSLSSVLETTPVSSSSLTQSESNVSSGQIEDRKVKKKTRVSKRLITDDEPLKSSTVENVNKKQCLISLRNEESVILETKVNDYDINQEVASLKKNEDNVKTSLKILKDERKNRKAKILRISSDEEDTLYGNDKTPKIIQDVKKDSVNIDDFENSEKCNSHVDQQQKQKSCVLDVTPKSIKRESKAKKPKLSPRNKKKTAKIQSDDEDDFSKNNEDNNKNTQKVHIGNAEQRNRQDLNDFDIVTEKVINTKAQKKKTDSIKNYSNLKVNEDLNSISNNLSKGALLKSDNNETELTPVLQDLTNEQDSHSPKKSLIGDHDYYIKSKNKTKIKRSLSMKKSSSSDDKGQGEDTILKECLITLSPLDIRSYVTDKTPSTKDIQRLEQQIKEKQKRLDDLKQAHIYQNKHNLKELEELTTLWKTGCISALNDLLPQLQAHVSIDMATLLQNLKIPPDMIDLSQDGNLI